MKAKNGLSQPSLIWRFWGKLSELSLSAQFLIAASVIVFSLMAGVSFFTAAQVETAALNAAGSAGAVRMQTLIAPLVQTTPSGSFEFNETFEDSISALIGQGPIGQRIRFIKIWSADGRQIFPKEEPLPAPIVFDELARALQGETVVSRTTIAKHDYSEEERVEPLLEVYAPLVSNSDGKVLLAGEIYEESVVLEQQILGTRHKSMAVVLLISVPMLSLLYLVVRKGARLIEHQRRTLRESLRNAIELSVENNRLRLLAENARVEAGKLNERILDQIGSDLHDGSVQLLTLVKLRLSDLSSTKQDISPETRREALHKAIDLVTNVLDEIRHLSAGLVLPELEETTVDEAIHLAAKRYLEITGREAPVEGRLRSELRIPDLSICLYRFVLEGLLNSYRHAPDNRNLVRYHCRAGKLYVAVVDIGKKPVLASKSEVQRSRLGKVSQKRRIRNFGGRMRYFPRKNGTFAVASLPLGAD
ncbi:sensor histidine kinase [Rhizobium sp. AAP43]|uniref:sensor histidine kinase n=1 Tax=Rhizobium sp. AAP43 TaxID=1523420 RepID=UPI0006B903D7|nr:histidine kinase [Rhizobium sp. AAP43]KPF46061.1 histidine kinase [Rhizobium sp. AAP43]